LGWLAGLAGSADPVVAALRGALPGPRAATVGAAGSESWSQERGATAARGASPLQCGHRRRHGWGHPRRIRRHRDSRLAILLRI